MSDEPDSDEPDNVVLRYLRRIDSRLDELVEGQKEVRGRMQALEEHVARLSADVAALYGNVVRIDHRIDRIETRLIRIETRLGLVEA